VESASAPYALMTAQKIMSMVRERIFIAHKCSLPQS
jgi:hypothetical protein